MTRRLPALLLFVILAGLLAPAHFAKAGTVNYYGLSFDGSNGYVEAPNNFSLQNFTVIIVGDIHWTGNWQCFFNKGVYGVWFGAAGESTSNLYLLIGNGTAWKQAQKYYTSVVFDKVTMIGARWNGETSSIIINGNVVNNKTYTGTQFTVGDNNVVRIGDQHYSNAYPSNGTIYEVLVYNRALSDAEIQQIYNDPLHPPTDGLVLFYAPDSVDTVNGKWLDKSGNGNDGTIYGATPERVSIPKAAYYDASNSNPIAIENVSVALIANNTTTSLIPSFLTLPYNETVTLNVSATGYESRLLTIPTIVNTLDIYLQPKNQSTTLNVEQAVNATELVRNITSYVNITPINSYAKAFMDSGGSFGDTIKLALEGDSLMRLILPQVLILAIVIVVLVQTTSPLAALGGALIGWAMSLGILGEAPSLRNSGMTFMLVVFLVAWTLWDLFYNYSRET